jgi:hypothetical protein
MYYNFVKPHRGLTGAERHFTPAMKAGLTNRVWSYDDILDEVDGYWRHKALQPTLQLVEPRKYVPLAAGKASPLPYFVMYSPKNWKPKSTGVAAGIADRASGEKTEAPVITSVRVRY